MIATVPDHATPRWRRRAGLATAAGLGLVAIAAGVSAGLDTSARWTSEASAAVIPEVLYLEEEVAKVATIARVNADIAREVTVDVRVDDLARRAGSSGASSPATTVGVDPSGNGKGASADGGGPAADGGGRDDSSAGGADGTSGPTTGSDNGAGGGAGSGSGAGPATEGPAGGGNGGSGGTPSGAGGGTSTGSGGSGGTGGTGDATDPVDPAPVPSEPKGNPDRGKPTATTKDPKATVDAKAASTDLQEDAP